jgi:hypothetical protein
MVFDRLVARRGAWFEERTPFDHVLTYPSDAAVLIPLEKVEFRLQPFLGEQWWRRWTDAVR